MSILFEQFGLPLGLALLGVVAAFALLLGRKATRQVAQFRDEHHERFKGRVP